MKGLEEAQKSAAGNATANPFDALAGLQDLIPPGMGEPPKQKKAGGKIKKDKAAKEPDHEEL